jgi:hypothetical protein
MFEDLLGLWKTIQAASATPDSSAAAAALTQMGLKPETLAPLFDAPQTGGASNIGDVFANVKLQPQAQFANAPAQLSPSSPMLSMPPQQVLAALAQSRQVGANPTAPQLTQEQLAQLMGAMPDQRSNYSPIGAPSAVGRPALRGDMQMLANTPINAQRRLTLADLIHGVR